MFALYAAAWLELITFDLVLHTRDFATLYYKVKTYSLPRKLRSEADAGPIIAAFQLACIWYPRQVRCLQASAALTCLLRRYGVHADMVLGTQKFPFKAHAWVEVEGQVINDKEYTPEMYAVLDRC